MNFRQIINDNYGWLMVVVTSIALGIGIGAFNSISVFLIPITTDLGWLRGETSIAYLAGTISVGLGGIAMGYLADRYNVSVIFIFGTVCLGIGYTLLAYLDTIVEFYLFYIILGALGISTLYAPLVANVGNWFTHNKGLALGITTSGQALGNGIIPYFISYSISVSGWRTTYLICGAFSFIVLLPLAFLVRTPPSPKKVALSPEIRAGSVEKEFHPDVLRVIVPWLSTAVIFCCICMATPIIHVAALVQDKGIDAQNAAGVLSLVMISGFFGRIAFGKISDYIGGLKTYMLSSFGQTLFVFWFTQLDTLFSLNVLAIVFGFGYAGVMTSLTICVREMTPLHRRSVSLAIVSFFGWIGMGLGGFQGGYFFDISGDYTISYANAAAAGVINLSLLGGLYYYISKKQHPAPELALS
ncbi:MAG: MFS transporter [SAR324 cluster bacterium]|nr:MFS transporter [SAR324 cluster bacterium]